MHTQTLSFELRLVGSRQDLLAACEVRASGYGRHLPHLRSILVEPDLLDLDPHTVVALCINKASGAAVGTARFQTNAGAQRLLIEHSVEMPLEMQSDSRAEITRLSVIPGADPLVKLCLMKASYLFCMASQIRWMVIGARSEALIRQYRRLGFEDLFAELPSTPLVHAGNIPHRVLAFNVTAAESRWRADAHPLYQFMIETVHPDIQLFSTRPLTRAHEAAPVMRREADAAWVTLPRVGPPPADQVLSLLN